MRPVPIKGVNPSKRLPWLAGGRCGLLALLAGLFFAPPAQGVTSSGNRVPLPGSIREIPATDPANPSNPARPRIARANLRANEETAAMEFVVSLKMRDFAGLQARVGRGEIISPEEMAEKYFPLPQDYDAMVEWLTSQKFTIVSQDPSNLVIIARGTVAQVREAFQVSFARVAQEGREYTSATTTPSVPAALAQALVGVNGLQPHLRKHPHVIPHAADPNSATSFTAPFFPKQIAKAYGADTLTQTGAGQTIAIVMSGFPATSDLTTFWTTCGITQSLGNISMINVGSGPTSASNSIDVEEATLDVQWSSSIAPAAKVRVYGTNGLGDATLSQAYQQIYNDITTHPELNLHVLSLSYGGAEIASSQSQLQTDAQLFAQLASAGVTVFVSSGDGGSRPNPGTGAYGSFNSLSAETPSSDPSVTGVGGTSITLNASTGAYISESVWFGGGGGVSQFFTRPSWQTGTGTLGTNSNRLVPDVAAPADPNTGCMIFFNGSSTTVGGTSWSAPVWAGFCALINQARAANGAPPLGLLGPQIYPLLGSASFRDITSGNNGTNGNYTAGVGYDLCTGLGTPNMAVLLPQLTTVLTPPANQAVLAGKNAVFTVSGSGPGPLTYQWQRMAAGASSWVNLSNSATYSGVVTATLTVNAVTAAMSGDQFQCSVGTAGGGGAVGPPATLIVISQPLYAFTIAGQVGVVGTADGTGANALFSLPNDVAINTSTGILYVADTMNNTVRKITPAGAVTTLAGLGGVSGATDGTGGSARFNFDNSLDLDTSGNIFVADSNSSIIRRVTPAGVVTTFAGLASVSGTTNGTGSGARFNFPAGLALDSANNIYVADSNNNLIRKITPAGVVTTLAGHAGAGGFADGTGTAAQFNFPAAVAVDGASNVYVADSNNNVIRKVTPAGVVTTLAGQWPFQGVADGTGANARFNYPSGIAFGSDGNLYVTDTNNNTIRKITLTPTVVVTTLLGQPGIQGSTDGVGSGAQFNQPYGMVLDLTGNLFIADTVNNTIRKAIPASAPQVQTQPTNQAVVLNNPATFSLNISGTPTPTYQWQRQPSGSATWSNLSDNATYSGTVTSALTVGAVTALMSGDQFRCVASNDLGSVTTNAAALSIAAPPVITAQPTDYVVAPPLTAAFIVSATGVPTPLTYQWQVLLNGGSTWSNLTDDGVTYAGSTNSTLTVASVTTAMSGNQYRCVVSNAVGQNATSNAATLEVLSAAYFTWAAGLNLTGTNLLATATPFHDALPNLARYAMNLGSAPTSSQLPSLSVQNISGTLYLTLQYNLLKNLSGVQVAVQYSYDLTNWLPVSGGHIAQLADPNSQTSQFQASVAIPGNGLVFLRVVVVPGP